MRCVISVLGKDRSGIVAAISGVLAELTLPISAKLSWMIFLV